MVSALANKLARRGHLITLVIPRQSDKLKLHANINALQVDMIGSSFLTRIPSFCYRSAKTLLEESSKHDVIYTHGSLIIPPKGIPVITHFHSSRLDQALTCFRTGKIKHGLANLLYTPSDWICSLLSTAVITLPKTRIKNVAPIKRRSTRYVSIPNGVDFEILRACESRDSAEGSAERKLVRLVYFGRLDATKGLSTLIEAVNLVKSHELTLTIIGDGPEKQNLVTAAKTKRIGVRFVSYQSQEKLRCLLCHHDLAVLPSMYETFGLAALECIALQIPVITSSEYHDFGQQTFPAGDYRTLASQIMKFLSDPQSNAMITKKLRTKNRKAYSLECITEDIEHVLSEACRSF